MSLNSFKLVVFSFLFIICANVFSDSQDTIVIQVMYMSELMEKYKAINDVRRLKEAYQLYGEDKAVKLKSEKSPQYREFLINFFNKGGEVDKFESMLRKEILDTISNQLNSYLNKSQVNFVIAIKDSMKIYGSDLYNLNGKLEGDLEPILTEKCSNNYELKDITDKIVGILNSNYSKNKYLSKNHPVKQFTE